MLYSMCAIFSRCRCCCCTCAYSGSAGVRASSHTVVLASTRSSTHRGWWQTWPTALARPASCIWQQLPGAALVVPIPSSCRLSAAAVSSLRCFGCRLYSALSPTCMGSLYYCSRGNVCRCCGSARWLLAHCLWQAYFELNKSNLHFYLVQSCIEKAVRLF